MKINLIKKNNNKIKNEINSFNLISILFLLLLLVVIRSKMDGECGEVIQQRGSGCCNQTLTIQNEKEKKTSESTRMNKNKTPSIKSSHSVLQHVGYHTLSFIYLDYFILNSFGLLEFVSCNNILKFNFLS